MAVLSCEVNARGPMAAGRTFGERGAYEVVEGVLRFGVRPEDPANHAVVDLERATRDADGLVHFDADFCLLQPLDPEHATGHLLFDVPNRGQKLAMSHFNRADRGLPSSIDPGDGFLMQRGWTILWTGWQHDVAPSVGVGLRAPTAMDGDQPIGGQARCFLQLDRPTTEVVLDGTRLSRSYPIASPNAMLYVRESPSIPPTIVAEHRWSLVSGNADGPYSLCLPDGFVPGAIYELVYTTSGCPVTGCGLLAVRDAVSYFRYTGERPISHAIGFGSSQSGRFLRTFLFHGLNTDESGRRVFDGVLPSIAGARQGEFNHRFAQPSLNVQPGFGQRPPFVNEALLSQAGAVRTMFVNSGTEYWQSGASLTHSDIAGEVDCEPAADSRVYFFASTQHSVGALELSRMNERLGFRLGNPQGMLDSRPLLRAALTNLAEWVATGVEPPPSAFPRISDGTAVSISAALSQLSAIPGACLPDPATMQHFTRVDPGAQAEAGVPRFPIVEGDPYPTRVSAVDADGNEVGGIRLPLVSVPLATFAGWNPRDPSSGGAGQLAGLQGSTLPFSRTREERERSGDLRLSIAERYADRADFLAKIREASMALVAQRYLLVEDTEIVVEHAAHVYDVLTRS